MWPESHSLPILALECIMGPPGALHYPPNHYLSSQPQAGYQAIELDFHFISPEDWSLCLNSNPKA